MTITDLIPTALLARKAVVYVRQSTQSQVITNLESQRRQYDLVDIARHHGFSHVEVIDDDLGRSASGTVARPASIVSSPYCAPAKLVPFSASMLHGLRATVGTGITCSNCAAWSKPASLTMTASTIHVDPTIGCCWE